MANDDAMPDRIPNAETAQAIDDARQGKNVTRHDSAEAMFKKLGI